MLVPFMIGVIYSEDNHQIYIFVFIIAAFESFFSIVFCLDNRFESLSDVLKDHFLDMHTKFIPLFE